MAGIMLFLIIGPPVEFWGAVFSPTNDSEARELKYVVFPGVGGENIYKLAGANVSKFPSFGTGTGPRWAQVARAGFGVWAGPRRGRR